MLGQFQDYRINENDELELVIEKNELERARRYSDWPRLFAVGLLLKRGLLRKVDKKRVEFSPALYSLVAEQMGDRLQQARVSQQVGDGNQSTGGHARRHG